MAKLKLNRLLERLYGKIDNIVFYRWKDRDCARIYVKGRNPNTEVQKAVRRTFGDAVKSWQGISTDGKEVFNRKARNMNMSGYNLYISGYMKARIAGISKRDLINRIPDKVYSNSAQRLISSVSPPFTTAFIEINLKAHPLDAPG